MPYKQPSNYVADLQQRLSAGNLNLPKNASHLQRLIEHVVKEQSKLGAGWILVFADDKKVFSRFTQSVGLMLNRLKMLGLISFTPKGICTKPPFGKLIANDLNALRESFHTLGEQLDLWEFATGPILENSDPTALQTLILIALLLDKNLCAQG